MTTIIVLFFVGYIFHLLYKLVDVGMIFLAKFVSKFKKEKEVDKAT